MTPAQLIIEARVQQSHSFRSQILKLDISVLQLENKGMRLSYCNKGKAYVFVQNEKNGIMTLIFKE